MIREPLRTHLMEHARRETNAHLGLRSPQDEALRAWWGWIYCKIEEDSYEREEFLERLRGLRVFWRGRLADMSLPSTEHVQAFYYSQALEQVVPDLEAVIAAFYVKEEATLAQEEAVLLAVREDVDHELC